MWTLNEALEYIRAVQPEFKKFNYHIGLCGSVLNNGESAKDLDIVVMDMNNPQLPPKTHEMKKYLQTNGFNCIFSSFRTNYEIDNSGLRIIYSGDYKSKRIDWFVYKERVNEF